MQFNGHMTLTLHTQYHLMQQSIQPQAALSVLTADFAFRDGLQTNGQISFRRLLGYNLETVSPLGKLECQQQTH